MKFDRRGQTFLPVKASLTANGRAGGSLCSALTPSRYVRVARMLPNAPPSCRFGGVLPRWGTIRARIASVQGRIGRDDLQVAQTPR